jgi:hypothetical protein
LRHKKISLRAAKDQNIKKKKKTRLGCFDKI